MQLLSFSVTKYRSITAANRLPIGDSTILIGPNNEGKSNILRALVTSLDLLSRIGKTRIQRGRLRLSEGYTPNYRWETDFPISLQTREPNGESIFGIDLRLTPEEVIEFNEEVGSKLNGDLPIQLSLGKREPGFKVTKKGPGGGVLSKKGEKIAQFVSKRIGLSYIPAVRTARSAHDVVEDLLERELAVVEEEPGYQEAMAALGKLQKPVLDRLSTSIRETLKEFLPNVRQVSIRISAEDRFRALRRGCEIVVDDGSPTQLSTKGDGVQSLAALSLIRHASVNTAGGGRTHILAIEEPESHLHPNAIHRLKGVIAEIATKNQLIMTTHCPLLVNRSVIKSNILVNHNRATPARSVREIRSILGVRAADNLQHAELILLVEGEEDRRALKSLLSHHSEILNRAIAQGTLGIDTLQGGSNLGYKLGLVQEALCASHSFLDNDASGKLAVLKAQQNGLAPWSDVNLTICEGMKESEIEDLYEVSIYAAVFQNRFGVSTESPKFKGRSKWSDRARAAFEFHGKGWSEQLEVQVKLAVTELVEADPGKALNDHRRSSFDALVKALEMKLELGLRSDD